MKPRLIGTVVVALTLTLVWFAPAVVRTQQAEPAEKPPGPATRLADGHPDISGVWWGGAAVGAARGRGAGGGGRGGARGGTPPPTCMSLHHPEARARAKPRA